MYFIAFAGIVIGLITYNVKPPPAAPPKKKKKKKSNKMWDNECTESRFVLENGNTLCFYKHEKKSKSNNNNRSNIKTPLILNGRNQMSYTQL